ncbi:MAG: serine/threonine-protein kinase [Gemmataceae bacterium]
MSSRVDQLFERWQDLREQGRPVLPEWLCGDELELQRQLERRIDAAIAEERRRNTPRLDPLMAPFSPEDELTSLLRQRLRWLGFVVIIWWIVWILIDIDDTYPYDWFDIAQNIVNFTVTCSLTGLLWSRVQLSLKQLRLCEFTVFGLLVFDAAWDHYFYLRVNWVDGIAAPGQIDKVLNLYGTRMAMPWVFLMLIYAMYIPNDWRRCALVVGGMCALATLLTLPFTFGDGPIAEALWSESMREMLIWLFPSAFLAVWGTHKMARQREEVRAAREYGQYRLKRKLRRGGMGQLYLAEHHLLHRLCVIKVIHPDRAGNRRLLLRFAREVQTLATLTHPNIVQVFDHGTTEDGTFYFVMEYLPGLDLADLVAQAGALPAGRVVYLLRQVCSALQEAHASGLIHRDIKPHNIIASERGRLFDVAKLLDFGLVYEPIPVSDSADGRLTNYGSAVGTPTYMAPEQINGSSEPDARSDLYSLGAVAYFLLTSRPPFKRKSREEMLHAHLLDPVTPPSTYAEGLPADLEAIVLRCLEKDPDLRYPDAASLEAALASCSAASLWSSGQALAWWRDRVVDELVSTTEPFS